MIFLFCKEMIGGSLKIDWGYSWFCIRFQFFIQASFIVDSEGWYCVTNYNIYFSSLLFCFRSLDSLLWNLFLSLRPSRVFVFNLNYFPQRWILRSFFVGFSSLLLCRILKSSPLTNPFLTFGGWHEVTLVTLVHGTLCRFRYTERL